MRRNAYRSSKKSRTCERGRRFPCPRSPHRIRLGPGVPDLPEPFAIGREFARRVGKHLVERQALNFSGDERVDRAPHVVGYIGAHMVHADVRVGGAFAGFAAHGFGAESREAEEMRPHALDGDERALFLFGRELAFVWCHGWVSIFGQPSLFSRRGCVRVLPNGRPKGEGTARQMARQSLICTPSCEGVAPSGAPSGVLLRRRAALFVTVR